MYVLQIIEQLVERGSAEAAALALRMLAAEFEGSYEGARGCGAIGIKERLTRARKSVLFKNKLIRRDSYPQRYRHRASIGNLLRLCQEHRTTRN